MDELETAENGKFLSRFFISKEELKSLHIKLEIFKASYKTEVLKLDPKTLAMKDKNIYFSGDIILKRVLGPAFWVSTGVFFFWYM